MGRFLNVAGNFLLPLDGAGVPVESHQRASLAAVNALGQKKTIAPDDRR
jgi:hypothetical protein